MKICPGCFKEYVNGVEPVSSFTSFPFQGSCPECEQYFKPKLAAIAKKADANMKRNELLNSRFDLAFAQSGIQSADQSCQYDPSIHLRVHQFSLLEEIHQFVYIASFESELFRKLSTEGNSLDFFPERYFSTNAIMRVNAAWEKMIRFYSLSFDVVFDANKKRNSMSNLIPKLRKTKCSETDFYRTLMEQKSNQNFGKLEQARIDNDHNTSPHITQKLRDLVEIVWIVTIHAELLYQAVEEALDFWNSNTPSLNRTLEFADIPEFDFSPEKLMTKVTYVKSNFRISRFNQAQVVTRKLQVWIRTLIMQFMERRLVKNPPAIYLRIMDAAFRLNDAARSLSFSAILFQEATKAGFQNIDDHYEIYPNMNSRYFLFNALIRVYSAYDKITMVIQHLYQIAPDKKKTMEALMKFIQNLAPEHAERPPIVLFQQIMKQPEFKELYETRQNFSHRLIQQTIAHHKVREILDTEHLILVVRNIEMICEVINTLVSELES